MGPKHSGKTSAGLVLAALLAGTFIDLDALIETRTGKSPRTLYKEGPEFFKKAETQALESLIHPEPRKCTDISPEESPIRIIAAGGGIIDNPEAMALLKNFGLLIYLEVSPETAWDRICRSAQAGGGLPPFLDTDNPQETHRLLHDRRSAAYKDRAHMSIAAEGKTPEAIGREILSLWEKRGESFRKPSRR